MKPHTNANASTNTSGNTSTNTNGGGGRNNNRAQRPWTQVPEIQDAIEEFLVRLSEPARRWAGGLFAMILGHGGIRVAAELTGLHPDTVSTGKRELENGLKDCPWGRERREGAGRPPLTQTDPDIEADLEELLECVTGGDPTSGKTYTRKSSRWLRDELRARGHRCSRTTVAKLLKKRGTHCESTGGASPASRTPTATASSKQSRECASASRSVACQSSAPTRRRKN